MGSKKWNTDEEIYLKKNFGKIKTSIIAENLGRSTVSIHSKASKLGLKMTKEEICKIKWNTDMDNYIRENYGIIVGREIAKTLGISKTTLRRRAKELGLSVRGKAKAELMGHTNWTEEMDKYVIENYKKESKEEIVKKLGIKNINALKIRASNLNAANKVTVWTKDMDTFLEDNWGELTTNGIARKLGVSKHSVLRRAYRIGLRLEGMEHGKYLTTECISNILNTDKRRVYRWIYQNKLEATEKNKGSFKKYKIEYEAFIKFLEGNQHLYDTNLCDMDTIRLMFVDYKLRKNGSDIIKSDLPEWLENKIRIDKEINGIPLYRPYKLWTIKEERQLMKYVIEGKTNREISRLTGRTLNAVIAKSRQLTGGIENGKDSVWR